MNIQERWDEWSPSHLIFGIDLQSFIFLEVRYCRDLAGTQMALSCERSLWIGGFCLVISLLLRGVPFWTCNIDALILSCGRKAFQKSPVHDTLLRQKSYIPRIENALPFILGTDRVFKNHNVIMIVWKCFASIIIEHLVGIFQPFFFSVILSILT